MPRRSAWSCSSPASPSPWVADRPSPPPTAGSTTARGQPMPTGPTTPATRRSSSGRDGVPGARPGDGRADGRSGHPHRPAPARRPRGLRVRALLDAGPGAHLHPHGTVHPGLLLHRRERERHARRERPGMERLPEPGPGRPDHAGPTPPGERVVLTVTDFGQASLDALTSSPTAPATLSGTLIPLAAVQVARRRELRLRRGGQRRPGGADQPHHVGLPGRCGRPTPTGRSPWTPTRRRRAIPTASTTSPPWPPSSMPSSSWTTSSTWRARRPRRPR